MERSLSVYFIVFSAVFILILINLVLASFELGEEGYSIEKDYASLDSLKGWINISLKNESSNSLLKLNSSTGIKLKDFLEENSAVYNCFPANCKNDYFFSGGDISKKATIESGSERLFGFKVQGKVVGINSLKFDLESTAQSSCLVPLEIDLLDEGVWKFNAVSDDFSCSEKRGKCFQSSSQEIKIDTALRCEKVSIDAEPAYQIGAWVRKNGTAVLTAHLYDIDLSEVSQCTLPDASVNGGEIGCKITSEITAGDYYVCINADKNSEYTTQYEQSGTNCGFYDIDYYSTHLTYNSDYNVFVKSPKYKNVGKFQFNKTIFNEDEEELKNYLTDYIDTNYNGDCNSGCAIPMKIKVAQTQNITISNILIDYKTDVQGSLTDNQVYDLQETPFKISSDFLKLDLDNANLSVPGEVGTETITLSLGGVEIFEEEITISNIGSINSVFPLSVAAAVPTKFVARINGNITKYVWDFGTGSSNIKETNSNSVVYAYPNVGIYTLKLRIFDKDGKSISREFTVKANTPKEAANETIKDYRKSIEDIKKNITEVPAWYRKIIEDNVNIEDLDNQLKALERKFSVASSNSDFVGIMANLSSMKVPINLKIDDGSVPKLVLSENVDLDLLKELGAGTYEGDKYKEAVAKWFNTNIDTNLNYKTYSLEYKDEDVPVVSVFNLKINPKEKVSYGYLILNIDYSKSKFIEDYEQEDLSGKTGIILEDLEADNEKSVEFSTSYISPGAIIIYLSPKFSLLNVDDEICNNNGKCEENEDYKSCSDCTSPWTWVIIIIVSLFLLGIIAYVVMKRWYRYNYEKRLFKNKNDLFNLVNFIKHSKSKGIHEKEIKEKLKRAGWNSEQISYAFKNR